MTKAACAIRARHAPLATHADEGGEKVGCSRAARLFALGVAAPRLDHGLDRSVHPNRSRRTATLGGERFTAPEARAPARSPERDALAHARGTEPLDQAAEEAGSSPSSAPVASSSSLGTFRNTADFPSRPTHDGPTLALPGKAAARSRACPSRFRGALRARQRHAAARSTVSFAKRDWVTPTPKKPAKSCFDELDDASSVERSLRQSDHTAAQRGGRSGRDPALARRSTCRARRFTTRSERWRRAHDGCAIAQDRGLRRDWAAHRRVHGSSLDHRALESTRAEQPRRHGRRRQPALRARRAVKPAQPPAYTPCQKS